jgi:hypothetical protein
MKSLFRKSFNKINGKAIILFSALFVAISIAFLIYAQESRTLGILIYTKTHTNSDGQYNYVYYPEHNISGYSYNMTRHVALIYALADFLQQKPFLASLFFSDIQDSLSYALKQSKPCTKAKNADSCIYLDKDAPALGANAVTIIALTQTIKLYPKKEAINKELLANAITLEKYLSTSFVNNKLVFGNLSTERGRRYESGQALMAWVSLHTLTNNDNYLLKAKALKKSILADLTLKKDNQLNHWYWIGLRDYYLVSNETPTQEEKVYLRKVAKHLISLQVQDRGDLQGTFNQEKGEGVTVDDQYDQKDPTSVSVRVEGMGALIDIFKIINSDEDEALVTQLKKSVELAIPAIDKNQITLRKILTEDFSFQSFGGYHRNGLGSSVQIDYLQHPLAAYQIYNKIRDYLE